MLSYQGQYTEFQNLTSDDDSTNLSMGKTWIRQGQRKLDVLLNVFYQDKTRTFTTVDDAISGTSNQAYQLPENFRTLTELYVTVGTTQYHADLIQNINLWRTLNSTTTQSTSNFLSHCFIKQDRIELYPIPSSANTATMLYRAMTKPLSQDDYTTGTITTLANGSTSVTGSGTSWTSSMVGRYFRIDDDMEWYKISAVGGSTSITLEKEYQGVSISGGSESYTIGEFPNTPPETHILPVYYAVWMWALFRKDVQLAREYERLWKEGVRDAEAAWANRSSSPIIPNRHIGRRKLVNPNYYPLNLS